MLKEMKRKRRLFNFPLQHRLFNFPLQRCLFNFLNHSLSGADSTTIDREFADSGYAMLDRWLAFQLTMFCTGALLVGVLYWFVCVLGPAEQKGKRVVDLFGGSISADRVLGFNLRGFNRNLHRSRSVFNCWRVRERSARSEI